VVSECLKNKHNSGSQTSYYYWRDNKGVEVDLLADTGTKLLPIEIKSSQTFREDLLDSYISGISMPAKKGEYFCMMARSDLNEVIKSQ